ncbi:MAG: YjbH domain-containing protein [Tannerella sp.]|jgi:hypothetical protein|nr:YjbH domain-containing protein [Tannerella sp.]
MLYKRLLLWISGLCFCLSPVHAQYALGVSGLLNIPSADMQAEGMFMAGADYLPFAMLPEGGAWSRKGTANYFLNITFLPFLEVAYRCTLLHTEAPYTTNRWQQDRSVSLRLRLLPQGHWWPALLVGSNDAFTTGQLNPLEEVSGNRYFSSVFAVATRHFHFGGNDWGLTFGGMIPMRKGIAKRGLFGGVCYTPPFCRTLRLMAEYDTEKINAGAAWQLFRHFSVHLFTYGFRDISGGLRYEFQLFAPGR